MLQFNTLSLRRGAKVLFQDASAQIHPGNKVGITGANGCGKSSLFQLILGGLHADAGDLLWPRQWVIAHVAQEIEVEDRSALDYVLDGDTELRQVEARMAESEGERLAELLSHYQNIGGYEAQSRGGRLLHGLGFKAGDETRPVREFSGGWRMRLNLGRALMCRSDLLLLDEPTNHLDLDAVLWLERWLRDYSGTLLLISHDRDFLDAVTDRIAHIEHERLTLYPGNYSDFERIRAERLANQQSMFQKQQREIEHMRAYVDRFRAKATKARQAQSRLKALQRMTLIAPAHVDSPFHFAFKPPLRNPNPLIRFDKVDIGYDDQPVLRGLEFDISPGARIGLLGHNGAGKSTLVKALAGSLAPMSGTRETAADLLPGYFAQHSLEQLDARHSPVEHLLQLDPRLSEQQARDFVGGFGFNGDMALAKVEPFSGGEKSRLSLALLVYRQPNLLLLDEPTNHLDLEMREALTEALQGYEGALIVVSHDRHLLRSTCDELWLVNRGGISEFDGDLDDYPRWLQQEMRESGKPSDNRPRPQPKQDDKRARAEQRKRLAPLKRKVEDLEKQLDRAGRRRSALEDKLGQPELYDDTAKDELLSLLQEKAREDAAYEELEETLLEALESLETAEQEA